MAGDNQHHVWQFIQRGFGEKNGKDHHIWVYDRDGSCKRTSTKKYGAKKFYFSDGEDRRADETLTDFENRAQSILQEIKLLPSGTSLDPIFIGELLAHFEVRSLYIREEASRLGERLIRGLTDMVSDEKTASILLISYLDKHRELIEEQFENNGIPTDLRPLLKTVFDSKAPGYIKSNFAPITSIAKIMLHSLIPKLEALAKDAHLKVILGGFSETERTRLHQKRRYCIVRCESKILLPDTGVAFLKSNGVAPMISKDDAVDAVICPLTEYSYIYGSSSLNDTRSLDTVRSALASCSYVNFIAREENDDFKRLARRIGKNARLVSDREVSKILSPERLLDRL